MSMGRCWQTSSERFLLDDAGEERKQMVRCLEDCLVDPVLSSLYLNHHSEHSEGFVKAVLAYLQEHKKIQKHKGLRMRSSGR